MLRRCGSAFVNAGDGRHFRFNFPKADSDTANFYELASASFDPQVSFVVTAGEVARLKPAVAKLPLRRFGVIKVSGADRWTTHLDLAGLPCRQFATIVTNDADHQIVHRQSDAAELFAQAIRQHIGNPGCGFGLAIHDKELCCWHHAVHRPDTCRGKCAPCLKKAPQFGQLDGPEVRAPQEDVVYGWHTRERRTTVRIYRAQDFVREHEPRVEHNPTTLIQMG